MIDPENVTVYDQSLKALQEFALFWVCAAGKNGRTAARCLNTLLEFLDRKKGKTPFELIRAAPGLPEAMKACGIGCYTGKARTFKELARAEIDLRTCTAEELEQIHGIGRKTSRCFIMHSRKDARYAGLDTHMLKYLRAAGVENVPKATPSSKKEYERLEKEVLRLADGHGMTPADFDLMVWNKYSVKSEARA